MQDVYLTPLISYVEKGQDHLFSVQRGSRKTRLKQECLMEWFILLKHSLVCKDISYAHKEITLSNIH